MYLRLYNLTFYRRAIWSQCTCAIRVTVILFNWDFRPFLLRILAFWCHQYYRLKTVATILWGKKETHFEKKNLPCPAMQFQAPQITDLLVPFQYLIWAAKNIGNNGRSLKPWCLAINFCIALCQGLLYHRTCKRDFLCSWPSLNSYLK